MNESESEETYWKMSVLMSLEFTYIKSMLIYTVSLKRLTGKDNFQHTIQKTNAVLVEY